MSHYVVGVITNPGQDPEELLAPYDEGIEVEPYVTSTKAEIIQYWKNRLNEVKEDIASYEKDREEYLKNANVYWDDEQTQKLLALEGKPDEDFYKYARDGSDDDDYDEDGNEISTYNPKSKWDWYELGGRFDGRLLTKTGESVNECLLSELDASDNEKAYKEAERWWEVVIDGQPLKAGEKKEDFETFYKNEYYTKKYKDKETYAKCMSKFSLYAVITPDGEWHEPGAMGWFGVSHAEDEDLVDWYLHFKERYIDTCNGDCKIYVVDCHI